MSEPAVPAKISYSAVEMESSGGAGMLVAKTYGEVVAFAQVMATADIALPKHLRGNPGACMAVAMQAMRWGMDPFAVANKTYFVNDRLAYEAQLVASVIITRAPIKSRPVYTYTGEGQTRRCKVTIEMKDGQVLEYESPMLKDVKVQNSPLWKADLDQQFGYYSIRSWGRKHAPEFLLGVYTPDEAAEMRDITPQKSGVSQALADARQGAVGGFSVEGVAQALDATFEDMPYGDEAPAASEPESGPEPDLNVDPRSEEIPVVPEEAVTEVIKDPLSSLEVDISECTTEQIQTWVMLLKSFAMRQKTPQDLMALWRAQYDRITDLNVAEPLAYQELEAWWEHRIKRLRADERK